MKKALLFVLALVAVGCSDPIPRNLDDLSMQGPQYLDPETLEPYRGPAYRMSEDDSTQIVLMVNLRDGRFHGDYEDFEPEAPEEGTLNVRLYGLYETGTYRDGQLEGRYEHFYQSGVLRGRGTYENGESNGPYESYHENGELSIRSNYVAGELDGLYEGYYENGELSSRRTYRADQRDGPYESYHEKGPLWEKGTYAAGERDGPFEFYDDNGQLRQRGTLNMGEECGVWLESDQTVTYDPC